MASRAFSFLREGAPSVRTWASRGRLVFVLQGGGIAIKCVRMSVAEPVFVVFGTGLGSTAGSLPTDVVGEFAHGSMMTVGLRAGGV